MLNYLKSALIKKPNFSIQIGKGPFKGQDVFDRYPIEKIFNLNHDSKIFRFSLPSPDMKLGLPIGQHMIFRAQVQDPQTQQLSQIIRKYTPISSHFTEGFFDILIKIYQKSQDFPNGGLMTTYLDTLKEGDYVEISGPRGRCIYQGRGQIEIDGQEKHIKRIGFIAGGTGIAPIFQLMQAITNDKGDKTSCSLIYANKTEEDILLRIELEEIVSFQRLHLYYLLDKPPSQWDYGAGYINEQLIRERLPSHEDKEAMIMYSGPKKMNVLIQSMLKSMGYEEGQYFKF